MEEKNDLTGYRESQMSGTHQEQICQKLMKFRAYCMKVMDQNSRSGSDCHPSSVWFQLVFGETAVGVEAQTIQMTRDPFLLVKLPRNDHFGSSFYLLPLFPHWGWAQSLCYFTLFLPVCVTETPLIPLSLNSPPGRREGGQIKLKLVLHYRLALKI